ncbi:MAG: glycoside hydrolase family 3 C-terminal domain-containing protein [Eubacteriales bacterium]|nr:glycoside hydrolase family 3 C-terminal domain-containing protein [Eubacteriales bacterium]
MKRKIRTFSGTKNPEISARELAHRAVAKKAAIEGIVLLENEDILPLSIEKPIALFGAGAGKTMKGGTGSGDVCERASVSIYQGMKEMGAKMTSEDWILDYDARFDQARLDWKNMIIELSGGNHVPGFFDIYAQHAFEAPCGRQILDSDCQDAEAAIYVISRTAGEGADRKNQEGDYQLTKEEIKDLETLASLGKKIIVLINSGGLIDLKAIKNIDAVKAILYISQPGMEGGYAVADVLFGKASPSGKLTDTWPLNYEDVPNAATFSYLYGSEKEEKYEEGIYVGYRYFDSFDVNYAYSFGHGLSYTKFEFDVRNAALKADGNTLTMSLKVSNIGNYAGKEVAQIYVACPQGKLAKEYRRLVAFKKTALIEPGQSEELTITWDAKNMASFSEEDGAWIMEAGTYYVFAGDSLKNAKLTASLLVENEAIIEEAPRICPLQRELTELLIPEDIASKKEATLIQMADDMGITAISFAPEKEELPIHVESKYEKMAKELVEKLSEEELIAMSIGEVSRGHDVALGAAGMMVPGAAGETSGILEEKYDFPAVAMADGPAGIRIIPRYLADEENGNVFTQGFTAAIENGFFADPLEEKEGLHMYYQYCTAFPIGTMMAQTWNEELVTKIGEKIGKEMVDFSISWWLAPGMNIHRNPLCGRNFEYYSEDPVVAGKIAAAVTKGVQSNPGVGTTIKHFAANNQEENRLHRDSILSERTLREIYLRGFEIAVKEAQPMSIMSSYNLLNGVHTANCKDILMTVLRGEWDFKGFVMTDWTTTQNGSQAWMCPATGNDLIMPGAEDDFESIREALADGRLSMEELRSSVARLICVIYQTIGFEDAKCYGES